MSGAARAKRGTFLEASAGTGKTTALVDAIVAALEEQVPIEKIASVTFTHQAAGEMKLRLRQKLDLVATPTAQAAAQSLDKAFIGTIHAFCANLIRHRPVEASVDPSFQELDEPQARRLFARVFSNWLERQGTPLPSGLKRAFARLSWMDDHAGSTAKIRDAAWNLCEWRDHPTPWQKPTFDRVGRINALRTAAATTLAIWPDNDSYWAKTTLSETLSQIQANELASQSDLDEIESELLSISKRLEKASLQRNTDAARALASLKNNIAEYAVLANAELAALFRDDLWAVVEAYEQEKARIGQLDFHDLLIRARDLVRNPEVRPEIASQFDRIFVDEFQDTDPLQTEIVQALVPPEHLFVVGDPKQSIYRFRRADPRIYRRTKEEMQQAGAAVSTLNTSYRATDSIQEFVNSAFQSMPDYLRLEGGPPALPIQPSIIALPVPKPYDGDRIKTGAILESTPPAVAAFIHWLIKESGWTVREKEIRRPIKAEDICILFRRMTNSGRDLSQDYVRSLEARNIEHVLVGSKGLHQREEILTLRTALNAVEWPEDELSIYATLRGPLFGITDEALFLFRKELRRLNLFAEAPNAPSPPEAGIWDALRILKELHLRRNDIPIADTIRRLLAAVRAHAIFAFHHGGSRRLANLHRLAELARLAETSSQMGFREFVRWLNEEGEEGQTAEAPVLEQSGGVKLMTVHKAKGLEFPIVILADPSAGLASPYGPQCWIDSDNGLCAQSLIRCAPWELVQHREEEEKADREEGVRNAYVAATRAQDLLVICALGDHEDPDWWLAPFYDAIYPPPTGRGIRAKASGCPEFGGMTVLNPPMNFSAIQVRPGEHTPRVGNHRVVWFDPALLDLKERTPPGTERIKLLDGTPEQIEIGLRQYREWSANKQDQLDSLARPSISVERATEAPEFPETAGISVVVETIKTGVRQPGGRRYGRLLHAVLQSGGYAAAHGRKLAATADEIAAAEATAKIILAHSLVVPNGREVLRELPVVARMNDGTLIEGRIDLALGDGKGWVVIDYKTGPADEEKARRQLRLYAYALTLATKLPTRAAVLEIT